MLLILGQKVKLPILKSEVIAILRVDIKSRKSERQCKVKTVLPKIGRAHV